MAKLATICLSCLLLLGTSALAQLRPMAASDKVDDPAYLTWRCSDFILAIRAQSLRLRAELSRQQPEIWNTPHLWTRDRNLSDSIQTALKQLKHPGEDFVASYITAFAAVAPPERFSDTALYISDKATCLSAFGSQS